jgi:hypothetical protein
MTRPLGWLSPDRYGRPHAGRVTAPSPGLTLPSHVRLDAPAEVYDQRQVGSCVAQALACAAEILAPRAGYTPERPDRTALYYRARRAIGTTREDSGAIIADGIEVLRGGWERELVEPAATFDGSYTAQPRDRAPDAPRLVSAEPLAHDLDSVCWELACGHPVVVGVRVTDQWDAPGEVLPAPDGDAVGGHAVCLVGYQCDAHGVQLRVRNSWGISWGAGGEAWLPAAWLSLAWCGEIHALRAIRHAPGDLFPPKGSDLDVRPDYDPRGAL